MTDTFTAVQDDIEVLLEQQRVVEVKSDDRYNVYLKEYDESFSAGGLNAEIIQVHPRKQSESPFAVRLYMGVKDD